jgi:hypothetical protein
MFKEIVLHLDGADERSLNGLVTRLTDLLAGDHLIAFLNDDGFRQWSNIKVYVDDVHKDSLVASHIFYPYCETQFHGSVKLVQSK